VKEIPLTQSKVALVDDEDYEELSKYSWCANRDCKNGNFYARRHANTPSKKEAMHRQILGLSPSNGRCVDHIDGNGLNNQRSNLRVVARSENLHNRGKQSNNKT
jgi:hypothetical protein